jgi:hypothetical protein
VYCTPEIGHKKRVGELNVLEQILLHPFTVKLAKVLMLWGAIFIWIQRRLAHNARINIFT